MLRMAQIDGIAATRKNFYATIQDPKNKKIDEGIEDQREHFHNVSVLENFAYSPLEC